MHPSTGEKAVSLDDVKQALWEAHKRYEAAKSASDAARQTETSALNELNKAQRIFDAAVGDIRGQAPGDSDWAHSRRHGGEVPAR